MWGLHGIKWFKVEVQRFLFIKPPPPEGGGLSIDVCVCLCVSVAEYEYNIQYISTQNTTNYKKNYDYKL